MKNRLMFTLLALMVLAMTNTFALGEEKRKGTFSAGGCCGGENGAMTDLQDQSRHRHEQSKNDTTAKKEDRKTKAEYVCPMHPEVKSSSPGKCPKCKMDLVKVKKEKKSLLKQKMEAIMAGKYNCCIDEPCDECLKAHGSCDCKNAVKNDKPVCDECYNAWQQGQGTVSGKTAKDIKKGDRHMH
jgi:hypothetical protein